jgi:hypothetical protein
LEGSWKVAGYNSIAVTNGSNDKVGWTELAERRSANSRNDEYE